MNIPASQLVNVIPGVLLPGGNALSLNAIMLTESERVLQGQVQAFETLADVQDWFGPSSIEATLAAVYFAGFTNSFTLPGTLYFASYNEAAVEAYLRSGSFAGVTLAQLQAFNGTLIVTIDGSVITTPNIDLAAAVSFTNAAALIQAGLQAAGSKFVGVGTISDGAGGPGNILDVTAVTSGALSIGDIVVGGPQPATITAFLTGNGGVGTYTVGGAAQDFDPGGAITVASAATVTYDAQLQRFLIHSATTGVDSSIGFATGTIAEELKLQAAQGAQLSQGADAAVPGDFMAAVALTEQNWASFMTTFEPDTAGKLAFAQWVQTTNQRYAYVAWDSDPLALVADQPTTFGAQCVAADMVGIYPHYEPADDNGNGRKAAFICGCIASIDYEQPNSRITFAFKGQPGLVADITSASVAAALESNGYNYYAAYATANDRFVFEQRGSTPGPWVWFDPYVNQIWLNSALQLALMSLLAQQPSIPYNSQGYNLIRAACTDPIQRALANGVIQPGVTLSNSQRAQVNTAAGQNIADALQNNGYYLQILAAPPETRVVRGSPPMTLWYTDGGSIQKIELASIDVQ